MIWGFTYWELGVAAGMFVGSTLVTTGIVCTFLVRIRPDYFVSDARGLSRRIESPVLQALYLAGKNLLGVVLILIGIVLSLPGVPGQGLLTIFVGILLLDVPGKRALELKLIRRNAVRRNINRLRARFNKPPLEIERPDAPHQIDMPDS